MRPYFLSSHAQRPLQLAILCALVILFFAAGLPAAAQVDTNAPLLQSFGFEPQQIDTTSGPASLTVSFQITDDLSGVVWGGANFVSPSGQHAFNVSADTLLSGDALNGIYHGIASLPQFIESGTWTVSDVELADGVGNRRDYDTTQLQTMGFPTALIVTSIQDTNAPLLQSFGFEPQQIDTTSGPASLTVSFQITDDFSGVVWGGANFVSPSGQHAFNVSADTLLSGDALNGIYHGIASLPQFIESGTWTVSDVELADGVGNRRDYDTTQLQTMGFPTALIVTSIQDTNAPLLQSFGFEPQQIDTTSGPASLTVSFQITDDFSGVVWGGANFVSPSGQHAFNVSADTLLSGDALNGIYHGIASLPQFIESGTWTVSDVELADGVGNRRDYSTTQLQAMGFPTTLTNSPTKSPTSVSVNSSPNPSVFNQPVLFTATATSTAGIPTGTMNFTADGADIGSSTLDGSGTATLSVSSLTIGVHTIAAHYGGDASFSSSSASWTHSVHKATTLISMTSSVSPSSFHQLVTFSAAISPRFGGDATGSVTFYSDGSPVGTTAVSGNAASFGTSDLNVRTHTISAIYGGDSNFFSSTSALTQKVKKATTATALLSSQNPSFIGQPVTLTATITPAFGGVATGTVTFKTGTIVLSTIAISGSGASYTTDSLPLGSSSITAAYSGDANFGSSSKLLLQKVNKFATATALNSSLNPSVFGQSITLTASVSSSGPTPSGTIEFRAGTTVLGTGTLAGGATTFTTSALNAGTHSMKAIYSGDGSSAASTSPVVSQKVTKAATSVLLVSSQNPSAIGQSVTFTAAVSSSAGTPTGTVTFKAGTKTLGTAVLSNGTAAVAASFSVAKPQTINATYSGTTNYFGSSAAITQMVQ